MEKDQNIKKEKNNINQENPENNKLKDNKEIKEEKTLTPEEKVKELDIARRKYYLLSDIIIKNTNSPIDAFKNFIEKFAKFNEKTNINKDY